MVTAMVDNSKTIDSILIWSRFFVFFGCRLMCSWSIWDILNLHPNAAQTKWHQLDPIFWIYHELEIKNTLTFIQTPSFAIQIPENRGAVNWLLLYEFEDLKKKSLQNNVHAGLKANKMCRENHWSASCTSRSLVGNFPRTSTIYSEFVRFCRFKKL